MNKLQKELRIAEIINKAKEEERKIKEDKTPLRKSVSGTAYEKDPVGLAVEVFVAMIRAENISEGYESQEMMLRAIDRVKQAQKAFI